MQNFALDIHSDHNIVYGNKQEKIATSLKVLTKLKVPLWFVIINMSFYNSIFTDIDQSLFIFRKFSFQNQNLFIILLWSLKEQERKRERDSEFAPISSLFKRCHGPQVTLTFDLNPSTDIYKSDARLFEFKSIANVVFHFLFKTE